MGKIIPQLITRFDGGMSDSPRESVSTMGSLIRHFDIFSDTHKLTPYRSTTAEQDAISVADLKTYDLRDFQLGLDGKMYALAKIVATGYSKVVKKTDPTTGNWLSAAGNAIASSGLGEGEGTAVRISGCFIEWQSFFWFFEGTNKVQKCALAGTLTDSVATVGSAITSVAQGIVGQDGNLYLFYNNKVVKVSSAGAVTDNVAPAIPSDMRIVSVTRYGSYLSIGCAYGTATTTKPIGRSQVFIWDMVATTFSDIVDWGEGALRVLGNIEGQLCGVTDKYLSSSLGLARGSMVIRMWAGGVPRVMKEIVANQTVTADTATVTRFPGNVVIKNNRMYWVASVPFALSTSTESTYHLGIWVFGRKNANSNFTLSVDYVEEGVSASNFFINSFGAAGDMWFINHSADGSVSKTDSSANYTFTSVYETQLFNAGDSSVTKKLIGVTVYFAYLPASATVVLKYRKDEDTAFTTIFTHTSTSSISHSAVNIESTGASLPEYKEIIFRIESTGGAEITGFRWKSEIVDKDVY